MYLERLLQKNVVAAKKVQLTSDETAIPSLTPVQFACRRLLDSLSENETFERCVLQGIPYSITAASFWLNFRQCFFSRKKKHEQGYEHYGGLQNLYHHGKASGWKHMLKELVRLNIAAEGSFEDKECVKLVLTVDGAKALDMLQVSQACSEKFANINRV